MIPAMAGRHESKITSGEYGPVPWLRRARALRVDPQPEGPEGLGPDRPLRHVSGNRTGARSLGERPKQMTNDQFQNPNGRPNPVRSLTQPHGRRYHAGSFVIGHWYLVITRILRDRDR